MGSKSQRKKEQFAQRRNEKRKRQQQKRQKARGLPGSVEEPRFNAGSRYVIPVGSNTRHRERLAQQLPRIWSGELPADAAIFEDSTFSALPSNLVPEVLAVRAALQEALKGRGDEALKSVSAIPRSSPLSEWRLFIRGLIDWLADESSAAGEAWKRLDPERRAGRIATTMMLALRPNLEQAIPLETPPLLSAQIEPVPSDSPSNEQQTSAMNHFDADQLYGAKLLRRVRFERAAVRAAESGLKVPEESKQLLLGPSRIQWVARFIEEYSETEPELATALAQVALSRAFAQTYSNLFEDAIRKFPGPRHDPRNRLLTFFYYTRFDNDPSAEQKAERALQEYLNSDLPQNESLSAPLRSAITSFIHLQEALALIQPVRGSSMFDLFLTAPENTKAIREHLLAAVKAVPAHGEVYKAHVEWIQSKLDQDRLGKAEQTRLEKELANVMRTWSKGMPDDVEPRLWLVDHLLENEELEQARPHVDFLAATRQDNPRVRATPWKWQMLEAMRLCRRKAWLADVPARLDEAETLWPAWLPKHWLPYLRAAWTLRVGLVESFEFERQQICKQAERVRDSLADACMMLGAAQLMRATAEELKPLRAAVDRALKEIQTLPLEDLLETGAFFWDLQRVKMLYPAYRLQGKTIGKALLSRLGKNASFVSNGSANEYLHKSLLWGSECRFWPSGNVLKLPSLFANVATQSHPAFAAAKVNAILKDRYLWNIDQVKQLGPQLRKASASERDLYNRYWYAELVDKLDDKAAKLAARYSGSPFGNLFGMEEEVDDDDDGGFDDDLGFDPNCTCSSCRAAKKAYQRVKSAQDRISKKPETP